MLLLLLGWGSSAAAAAVETHGNALGGFASGQQYFERVRHNVNPIIVEPVSVRMVVPIIEEVE